MPDIEVALSYALAQIGKPYCTWGGRFGPDCFDCSGLVIRSLAEAGVRLPNGISAERGWGNSVSLYNWAKDVGGLVSVDKAVRTRGAILIRGRWYGYGPLGDVKFSLGDGRQTGAGSRRTGVATRTVFSDFFHDGFIIPGVNYHLAPPVPPPPPPTPVPPKGRIVDYTHTHMTLMDVAWKAPGYFESSWNTGVNLAPGACWATLHGPKYDDDGAWPWLQGASVRVQIREQQRVLVSVTAPNWKDGNPLPMAHVFGIPA